MKNESVPLCCCEYYDLNHERNHILACFCNCADLDEAFESLISTRNVPQHHKSGIMTTIQDRLRVPWKGGAKQIVFDAVLPIFIIPVMLLLASISLWWTIFSFTIVPIFLVIIFNFVMRIKLHTKFFFAWTITSLLILYTTFEFLAVQFLNILLEEHIALGIIIFGFIICLLIMKIRTKQLKQAVVAEVEIGKIWLQNCSICQIKVPDRNHHCVWFDCCIGKHNQCLYIMSLLFIIEALLYSSYLTLTCVCHPFTLYKTVLLPDDCSDVYKLFELSISFVTALYSLLLAILLVFLFLQQLILVSMGMTIKEWRSLPFTSKLCFGITANRPRSQGFFRNWLTVIC